MCLKPHPQWPLGSIFNAWTVVTPFDFWEILSISSNATQLSWLMYPSGLNSATPSFSRWSFLTPFYCLLRYFQILECKNRKSRNTWSNRQICPWSTEWSRAKANRVLPRKRTGHCKHPLPTTQEKTLHMTITRWSTPKSGWLYSLQPKMEKLYTVSKNKTRSWLWLRSWIPYCQIQI